MALAENQGLRDLRQKMTADQFAKRRQDRREAAEKEGGTPGPEGGGEDSPLAESLEVEREEVPESEVGAEPEAKDEPEAPKSDLDFFDDDELGEDAEPTKLSGLEPPAALNAAEKEAFEGASDELKAIITRVSKSAARKVTESGESLATERQALEAKQTELDRALIEAKAVLDVEIDVPFKPPYSEDDLDRIFSEQGAEAERAAQKQNRAARAEHEAATAEMKAEREKQKAEFDAKLKERQQEILKKLNEDLPKLIPSWANSETRKAEAKDLSGYLLKVGFTEAEVRQVADARLVALSRKAMRYDAALARKRESRKGAAKTAKPAPTAGRARQSSNITAELEAAEKAFSENRNADTFARRQEAKRKAAAVASKRRRA